MFPEDFASVSFTHSFGILHYTLERRAIRVGHAAPGRASATELPWLPSAIRASSSVAPFHGNIRISREISIFRSFAV